MIPLYNGMYKMGLPLENTMAGVLLKYSGGKGRLAKRIIARFPPHTSYLEPCCGGAAVLLNKPRSPTEIITDTDEILMKMWLALRDTGPAVLTHCAGIEFTQEWLDRCREGLLHHSQLTDPWVAACKIFVHNATRSGSMKGKLGTWTEHSVEWYTPSVEWKHKRDKLPGIIERIQGVQMYQEDVFLALRKYPSDITYVDPPYLNTTQHGTVDHAHLAALLLALPGARFITHYKCLLYDALYADWHQINFTLGNQFSGQGKTGKSKQQIETLYFSSQLH